MCGIVGVFNKSFKTETLIDMIVHWRRKGTDGVGIWWKDGNTVNIFKKQYDPVSFILEHGKYLKEIYENKPEIFVYHTRAASIGKVDENGLHPFVGKRYIVTHNGTIRNHDLIPLNPNWDYKALSDTEKITAFLNEDVKANLIDKLIDKLQALVNKVGTIGVLVIYDKYKDKVYLYRDHTRELVLTSDDLLLTKEDDKDMAIEDISVVDGFFNSMKLARRFIAGNKLKYVEPYTVLELDTDGSLEEIYELSKPKIKGGVSHYSHFYGRTI